MNEMQVLDLVIQQMGELRIPLRETELREQLIMIARNIQALRDAMEAARTEPETGKDGGTAGAEGPEGQKGEEGQKAPADRKEGENVL